MLDKALRDFLIFSSEENRTNEIDMHGDRADTGNAVVLVTYLMTYRTNAIKNNKMVNKAEFTVGGIVTPFLEAAGVPIMSDPTPPLFMDMVHMRDTKTIDTKMVEEKYVYNFSHPRISKAKIFLPYGGLAMIYAENGDRSIAFLPPARDLYFSDEGSRLQPDEPLRTFMNSTIPPESFYFDETEYKSLKETNHKICTLQKWCKWQDKRFQAFKKGVNATMKGLTNRLAAAEKKLSAGSTKRTSAEQKQGKRRPDHPAEELEQSSPDSTTQTVQAGQTEECVRPPRFSAPVKPHPKSYAGYAQSAWFGSYDVP